MNEKNLILLDEYKRGFAEIQKLVNGFQGISNGSQNRFLDARMNIINRQLENIEKQKTEIHQEVKRVLVIANSNLLALADMETYFEEEIKKCNELSKEVNTEKEALKTDENSEENAV